MKYQVYDKNGNKANIVSSEEWTEIQNNPVYKGLTAKKITDTNTPKTPPEKTGIEPKEANKSKGLKQ